MSSNLCIVLTTGSAGCDTVASRSTLHEPHTCTIHYRDGVGPVRARAVAGICATGKTLRAEAARGERSARPACVGAGHPDTGRRQTAALKTLHAESDDAFLKNPDLEKLLDAQIARLGTAKYTIREFESGIGSDVVVLLDGPGGEETNIVIRFNDAKRVIGFAHAQIIRS
jgi:hypothetical protein